MVFNQVITLLVTQQLCSLKVLGRDTNRRLDTAHDLADRVKELRLRAAASSITHIAEGDIAPARVVSERRDRTIELCREKLQDRLARLKVQIRGAADSAPAARPQAADEAPRRQAVAG